MARWPYIDDHGGNGTFTSHSTYPLPYTSDLNECYGQIVCSSEYILINFTAFNFGPEPEIDEFGPMCP